ncbi:threonine synthase [Colletotrichum sojae]|uniref:Threonine synthase n=1 Tax=Colletotrichum sojae TaxID=2175907 RepID=A0A8H6JAM7_9PEZI|nr:threonine synthase [Colletotrichum sojae]
MAPAKIIADSDDSDDDFELDESPPKPPTPKPANEGRSSDPASAATGSTDPNFFQAIYNEQQGTASNQPSQPPDRSSAPNGRDSSSVSAGVKPPTKKDESHTSSLTSVTDPTMGSNRTKKTKKTEIVDLTLTQVTTPGRSADNPSKDMWDVPSSPAGASTAPCTTLTKNRTPASAAKRKRGNNVEFTSPLATAMPSQGSTQPFETTPARGADFDSLSSSKKQKIDVPKSSVTTEDDVDMIVFPRSNNSSLAAAPVSGQKQSVSLYIEPRSLSDSQKLQYEYHSVDPSPEDQRPATSRHITSQQMAARSSGATTIAYSTPSQRRILGVHPESFSDETDIGSASQRHPSVHDEPEQEAAAEPQSSPDIISEAPVRKGKRKDKQESPKASESRATDDWDSDEIGFARESYKPRLSRRRGSNASRLGGVDETSAAEVPMADMAPTTEVPAPRTSPAGPAKTKKRGRPKKSEAAVASPGPVDALEAPQSVAATDAAESPMATGSATVSTQQINKKKRGRPRKADKAKVQEPKEQDAAAEVTAREATRTISLVDSEDSEDDDVPAKAKKPSRAKRDKRPTEDVPDKRPLGEDVSETDEVRALQPMTPNAVSKPGSDGSDPQVAARDVTPGLKSTGKKEVAGASTPASSQAGKPLYRVGLSKKSRIAPLLKSLRK